MDLATGAMGSLLPKLVELLSDEYKLQKGVKESVKSLKKEMESMHAALRKVAEVPQDQLDEQVKLWAGEVRELSFDMEDLIDKFLVRVDDDSAETATKSRNLKRLIEKMSGLFTKGKARREIADAIKYINKKVEEVANRRERYNVDNIVAMPVAMSTIDPRLGAMYKEVTDLIGIAGKRDQELMGLLSDGDSVTKNKLRIISVVGFGGLGKTTLVKTVYDKIKTDFDCNAFVPVGRNADIKKIFLDILIDLNRGRTDEKLTMLDERQLIDKLHRSLKNKRYLIVIDDIWDEKMWKFINLALSKSNNLGSRIITTTRILSVSRVCCSSTDDSVYEMEPLSDDDSKKLFYKRIFSPQSGCPPELEEVSIEILKKCGGVPLAIITVASLLASDQGVKHVDEWNDLLGSIGRGLKEDPSVDEMLKILSFSYYDLPSHLKTCLLYLSMFPEDYRIKKDRLIWMWIAESFVQSKKEKTSLFEIGETYFDELVNRNMIMPLYDNYGCAVEGCRVHDMVLDLISSLAGEDNFVTVLNGTDDSMSSHSNVRRFSLQDCREGELQTKPLKSEIVSKVRSVAAFGPGIDLMPSLSSFVVLRVMNLTGCNLHDHSHLNLRDLGSMLHLRYLGLAETGIFKVPEEVGKLQFLEVLDLRRNEDVELPLTIIKLTRLMCLLVDFDHLSIPDGFGNLTSMEVLREINCDSISVVKELGGMENLRKLNVKFDDWNLQLEEAFVESLGMMSNIQKLVIRYEIDPMQSMDLLGERWKPPRSLKEFVARDIWIQFSTLPAWIRRDPSHLLQLSVLQICVKEVWQEDLDILGRLAALRNLSLEMERWSGVLLVGADGFRCLTYVAINSESPGHVMFNTGAMPKAEIVYLSIGLRVIHEQAVGNHGDYSDLGMGEGNLPSLEKVSVTFFRTGVTVGEAKQAEAMLANALRPHPNHPTFQMYFSPSIPEDVVVDDDVCYKSSMSLE